MTQPSDSEVTATPDTATGFIPEDTTWTTVSEEEHDEIKIVFDTIGDEFIGIYNGARKVPGEEADFTQHRFFVGSDHYFVNGNWSLNQAMTKVQRGMACRVTYVSDKDTGAPTPMRVYRVEIAHKQVRRTR